MNKFIELQTVFFYTLSFCIIGILSNPVFSQDHGHSGDVFIYVEKGHIETGLVDEDETEEHVRVFEAEFGESGLPGYTDEPGWEAFPGTFDPNLRLGWNATHGLGRWNGDGFDNAIEETIFVNFGTLAFEIGSAPIDGFNLAVQPDGGFHRHIGFFIDRPSEAPQAGIYIIELELYATLGIRGFTPEHSEPFWIVFNYLASEDDHEAAVEWVATNLADEDHGHDECHGDLDANDEVNVADLLILISDWGVCSGCDSDMDENGTVNIADLLELISAWGECH